MERSALERGGSERPRPGLLSEPIQRNAVWHALPAARVPTSRFFRTRRSPRALVAGEMLTRFYWW